LTCNSGPSQFARNQLKWFEVVAVEVVMWIEQRGVSGVIVLTVQGALVSGSAVLLRDRINSLVFQGHLNLLLDLQYVARIDSAGLGELIAAYATVSSRGGQIKIVGALKRVKETLALAKLLTVFECYDSETEALQAFTTRAA
jgi:anti-sigma B factor antagonist